jgi:hypothetical protein
MAEHDRDDLVVMRLPSSDWVSVASPDHHNEHLTTRTERSSNLKPEFISIPQWARRVGVSAESGYKAARLGQIPGCFPIGRLYRVNWTAFIDATTSTTRTVADDPSLRPITDPSPNRAR